MPKIYSKWMVTAAMATALIAGCGSANDSQPAPVASTDISQSISALYAFITAMIAGTNETNDPIDINPLTLATDDTAEGTPQQ